MVYVAGFGFLVGGEINAQIEHAAAPHGHPEAKEPGAYGEGGKERSGMGVDSADPIQDGWMDLFVTNLGPRTVRDLSKQERRDIRGQSGLNRHRQGHTINER